MSAKKKMSSKAKATKKKATTKKKVTKPRRSPTKKKASSKKASSRKKPKAAARARSKKPSAPADDHETTMNAVRAALTRATTARSAAADLATTPTRVKTPRITAASTAKTIAAKKKGPLYTRACELFGVKYPIIQTGMGWVSGATLTAATSEAGGLGILAAATMTFAELQTAIRKVKERTGNSFGVNLRADQSDVLQRCDLLIREKVKVASFAQAPKKEVIKKLKDAGLVVMPTIGARRHAEKVQEWGVDAVIAQGHEGGGHTGAVPTSLLIGQCVDAVDIPVIAAGGFHDGRGLVAALAYGASGIAMGTRFLLTKESQVPDRVKQVYLQTSVTGTVVTKAVDGYPQRVIRTPLINQLEKTNPLLRFPLAARNALALMKITKTTLPDMIEEGVAMKQSQDLTWSQLAMAANAPMLTKATMVDGQLEAGILPTGQVTGVIEELPSVHELITRIMKQARATLDQLSA